jgi:N-acetylglutamate synthase-like GNAT family acetyltransferase
MFYQLRIAEEKDVQALKSFIEKAGLSSEGIESIVDYFVVMESDEDTMVASLGIEPVEGDGLLRSLVVSENINQAHLLSLFESVHALGKEKGLIGSYLVTNKINSIEFLQLIGFQSIDHEAIPDHLLTSAHFKESLEKEHAVVMVKTA